MATIYVATTGNDSTGDGSSGNPYATPGKAAGVATTSGDIIYVKSGNYTTTSTSANVAGGRVSLSVGVRMEGYQTVVGDRAARPVLKAHAGSITLFTIGCDQTGSASASVVNMEADANGQSSIIGFQTGNGYSGGDAFYCVATSCATGFSNGQFLLGCKAASCTTGFDAVQRRAVNCWASGGTTGFITGNLASLVGCIASGASGRGFYLSYASSCLNCVAYNNGSHGFDNSSAGNYPLIGCVNCIAYGNSGYGFQLHASGLGLFLNNATGSNTSGAYSTTPVSNISAVTLSANPFTNAGSNDFSLNATAGGGAACRAAGYPGAFPGGTTTGYLDIGAAQHQDAGGTSPVGRANIFQNIGTY